MPITLVLVVDDCTFPFWSSVVFVVASYLLKCYCVAVVLRRIMLMVAV